MIDVTKVKSRMFDLKLSQGDLAEKSTLSKSYISALLLGSRGRRIGSVALLKLANALEVDPIFLLDVSTYEHSSRNGKSRDVHIPGVVRH